MNLLKPVSTSNNTQIHTFITAYQANSTYFQSGPGVGVRVAQNNINSLEIEISRYTNALKVERISFVVMMIDLVAAQNNMTVVRTIPI